MMKILLSIICFGLGLFQFVFAQQTGLFSKDIIFQASPRAMHYSVPVSYNSTQSYPLVVVLHGCGQSALSMRDDYAFLTDSMDAIVVAPQGPAFNQGFFMQQQNDLMIKYAYDSTEINYNIDVNRLYLLGFSCNGLSTYVVGTTTGKYMFRGIIPISATVSQTNMAYIDYDYQCPACICVGGADAQAVQANTDIRDSFLLHNSNVLYLETPGLGHDYVFNGYESKTMDCMNYIDYTSTAIHDNTRSPEISVFPNPAKDILKIKANNQNFKNGHYQVFNSSSVLVLECVLDNNIVDISALSKGAYYIAFRCGSDVVNKRFVKM